MTDKLQIPVASLREALCELHDDGAVVIELCEWGFRVRLRKPTENGTKAVVGVVSWEMVALGKANVLAEHIKSMREHLRSEPKADERPHGST